MGEGVCGWMVGGVHTTLEIAEFTLLTEMLVAHPVGRHHVVGWLLGWHLLRNERKERD